MKINVLFMAVVGPLWASPGPGVAVDGFASSRDLVSGIAVAAAAIIVRQERIGARPGGRARGVVAVARRQRTPPLLFSHTLT